MLIRVNLENTEKQNNRNKNHQKFHQVNITIDGILLDLLLFYAHV